jgi:mediator of replication checkpoint protein 1
VKQVEKLYNDITKGMLRRKRGAEYELSDSEDGGEARRRMKRKGFAKMRKALLADERIGKIAENPKRQAFLRAIEDRGTDDEANFLDYVVDQSGTAQSQSQSQPEEPHILDSQSRNAGPPKRKHSSVGTEAQQRLPPHLRRIKATQRPAGLSEIRESLSSLIEKPNAIVPHTESGSESEAECGTEGAPKSKENRPFVLQRTNTTSIDRIALKRAISSSVSTSARLAFAVSSTQSFKLPQILRRAASNNSIASTSTSDRVNGAFSSMERPASGAGDIGLKMGGRKNSSINHSARECMGKAIFIKTEKRRQQKISKGVEKRRRVIDGLFSKGNFE